MIKLMGHTQNRIWKEEEYLLQMGVGKDRTWDRKWLKFIIYTHVWNHKKISKQKTSVDFRSHFDFYPSIWRRKNTTDGIEEGKVAFCIYFHNYFLQFLPTQQLFANTRQSLWFLNTSQLPYALAAWKLRFLPSISQPHPLHSLSLHSALSGPWTGWLVFTPMQAFTALCV